MIGVSQATTSKAGFPRRLLLLFTMITFLSIWLPAPRVQAQAGDLDPSFGIGGKTTTPFAGLNDLIKDIAIQADGKIVAAGGGLARYNADGSLDTSFGAGGKVMSSLSFESLVLQPDGKIVAGGSVFNLATSRDFAVARFNPDGSVDSTFGISGSQITDFFSLFDSVSDLRLLPDGKIVAGGITVRSTVGGFAHTTDFALIRYQTDGSLDLSFGSGGKVVTDFGGNGTLGDFDTAQAVAVQPDGKILAGGIASGNGDDFAMARYNSDGSLDSSFGLGGKVKTDLSDDEDDAFDMALQPDGKIILVGDVFDGSRDQDFAIVRYTSNGSLDSSFGTGGKVFTDFSGNVDRAVAVALQSDGKIVAAGSTFFSLVTGADFGLARYDLNGQLDPSFGTGGKIITDFFGASDGADAVAIQSDGKIVAGGQAFLSPSGSDADFALARYLGDGPGGPGFDICIRDDSNGTFLRLNSSTGDYQIDNCRGLALSGVGRVTIRGCTIAFEHNGTDRRVMGRIDTCAKKGSASGTLLSPRVVFTIVDRNTANSICGCQ